MTRTVQFVLPDGAEAFDAAVFTQAGEWVHSGHREECEAMAEETGGLYCYVYRGRVILRQDFVRDFQADAIRAGLDMLDELQRR